MENHSSTASGSGPEPTPNSTPAPVESTPARKPWLSVGYVLFLSKLVHTREERGLTIEELAERIGLPALLVQKYEQGELPLDFLQTRTWCMSMDVPITTFTQELDELLSSQLDHDEIISGEEAHVVPPAPGPASDTAEADDEDPPKEPTIQVLVLSPYTAPTLVALPNTLEAMQQVVGGLIEPFETGVEGTIGIANEEGLLLAMPVNFTVPATDVVILGVAFIAGDAAPNFRSLTAEELERVSDSFLPGLSQADFTALMRAHPDAESWMASWD